MKKPKDDGMNGGISAIAPALPVVFEQAIRDFASKWDMTSEKDSEAEFFTVGDIRDTLSGCVPFSTNADPIEDIREVLRLCGIEEQHTMHSGVVYILRPCRVSKASTDNTLSIF